MNGLRFVPVDEDDRLAQPLLAELAVEYATRYEVRNQGWRGGCAIILPTSSDRPTAGC